MIEHCPVSPAAKAITVSLPEWLLVAVARMIGFPPGQWFGSIAVSAAAIAFALSATVSKPMTLRKALMQSIESENSVCFPAWKYLCPKPASL